MFIDHPISFLIFLLSFETLGVGNLIWKEPVT